jgi:hypothetical protein
MQLAGILKTASAALLLIAAIPSPSTAQEAAQEEDAAVPLLPARLGPMESLLWSESGWIRRAFDYPLTPQGRADELALRRNMLGLHQFGGFVTLAGLTGTVFLGQQVYNGRTDLGQMHGALALTTVGFYFATAALSLFTPPPAIRRNEWSSVSTHKLLGSLHFGGMMLTPVLGRMVADDRNELRKIHLVSGYATTAVFAASLLVVTF